MKTIPARLDAFAQAYAEAVLAVLPEVQPMMHGQTAEEHACDVTLQMVDLIQRTGVDAMLGYYLNAIGGAFRLTAQRLGIDPTPRAMENFLGGL